MPTEASLFIAPVQVDADPVQLAGQVSIRLKAATDDSTISDYSLTLDGYPLAEPALMGDMYVLQLDSKRYRNGTQTLHADATDSEAGAVFEDVQVQLNNTLETNTCYLLYKAENERSGEQISRANIGLTTYDLPDSNRLRYWLRARLLTENTPNAGDIPAIGPGDLDELAAAFAAGQPVPLAIGKITPASGLRQGFRQLYASHQMLTHPGQDLYVLLRLDPSEFVAFWETGFEQGVKLRRDNEASTTAVEIWYALYRNLDGSGAAIFRFTASGSLENPSHTFEQILDLTEDAPDATDFCLAEGKFHVIRESDNHVWVFDVDPDEAPAAILLPRETRAPKLIEEVGGIPVLICVDDELEEDRTRAWKYEFPSYKPVWTLDASATALRASSASGTAMLAIAAGMNLYTSAGGLAAPALSHTFESNIASLGVTPSLSLVGLENGEVWRPSQSGWQLLADLASAVTAVGAWNSDGLQDRAVAGRASNQISEEGLDGTWSLGQTLTPPEDVLGAVSVVSGLEGFERLISPASGDPDGIDFVPAVFSRGLAILTGTDGLFAIQQKSPLNEAAGAWLTYEFNRLYLTPLSSPIPTS